MRNVNNLIIRSFAMASRFLFILYLAKYFTSAEISLYANFNAYMAYSVLIIGSNYYYYFNRLYKMSTTEMRATLLADQVFYTGINYLIFVFFSLYIGAPGGVSQYLLIFLFILFCEIICQDIYRLLVMVERPIMGSFMLLQRYASPPLVILCYNLTRQSLELSNVMELWALCAAFTLFVHVICAYCAELRIDVKVTRSKKLRSIWKTVIVSLIGAIALRSILTFDRIFVADLYGVEIAANYILLMSVLVALPTIIDSLILSFTLPNWVRNAKNIEYITGDFIKTIWKVVLLLVLFSILFLFMLPNLFKIIGNDIYRLDVMLALSLLGFMSLYVLMMVFDQMFYALNLDVELMASNVLLCVSFLIVVTFRPVGIHYFSIFLLMTCVIAIVLKALIIYRYIRMCRNG